MLYTSALLRGLVLEVSYRVTEVDLTRDVFEADWEFTDPPVWADEMTDEEHALVMTAIVESAWDRAGDDLD